MRALIALLACALAVWTAPAAGAQPTAPPEVPPRTGAVFPDTPVIVDAYPIPVESWSRTAAPDVLAVHFTTGTPACFGVHAKVVETPDTVTVELLGGTLPEAVGRPCIAIAVLGSLEVALDDPVGGRRVLSVG